MLDDLPPLDLTPEDWAATPPRVQAAFRQLLALLAELPAVQARVAELEARLNQTSRNSSKPPSSAPPSAPPPQKTPRGSRFVERMLTVSATCQQHVRPLLPYLVDAITAHRANQPAPKLLPSATPLNGYGGDHYAINAFV